jgi:hypothetical protein
LCAQKGKAHRAAVIHNVKLGIFNFSFFFFFFFLIKINWPGGKVEISEKSKNAEPSSDLLDSSSDITSTTASSSSTNTNKTRNRNNDDDDGPMNASRLFSSRPTFQFSSAEGKWCAVDNLILAQNNAVEKLVVVSYNILFDLYDKEKIHTENRYSLFSIIVIFCRMPTSSYECRVELLLELLKETNADVVGLIEVTQRSLMQILRNEWMQKTYYVSECGMMSIPLINFNLTSYFVSNAFSFRMLTSRIWYFGESLWTIVIIENTFCGVKPFIFFKEESYLRNFQN